MRYRPDIDGLRTIAVGLVLLFHAHLGVSGGFVGVDVFFVISGFLITRTISEAHDRGGFSLLVFYDHRARRILPALVPLLLITSLAATALMLPIDLVAYGKSVATTALFGSNVWFWLSAGYFDTTSAANPLLHTWSLGVEEQFYIFFPLLMMVLFRMSPRWRIAVIGAITGMSFIASWILVSGSPDFTFYQLPTRAWELMVGSLISFRFLPAPRPAIAQACSLVGLAAVLGSAGLMDDTAPFPGPAALPSVIGSALIIYAGIGGTSTPVARLLSTPPFRFMGLISYSLYLWHWPILVFYSYTTDDRPIGVISISLLLLAVLAAAISYKFVEQPWRRRSPTTAVFVAPLAGLFAMAAVCVVGGVFYLGRGFPQRLPADVRLIAAAATSQPSYDCTIKKPEDIDVGKLCRIGDEDAESRWVLWGDSHGWALKEAFSLWLKERHASAWAINSPGCAGLVGYQRIGYSTDCKAVGDAAIAFILSSQVSDVIEISSWGNWFSQHNDFLDEKSKERSRRESTAVISRAFSATIGRLHDAGIHVWMFDPLPQAKGPVPSTLAKQRLFGGDRPLAYSIGEYHARNADYFTALLRSAGDICGRFEIERTLCSNGTCAVANVDGPLYFDSNHPAAYQTGYFAELLAENTTSDCSTQTSIRQLPAPPN